MTDLPVNEVIPQIKTLLREKNQLILQAPPGAGKTTIVPISLLDEEWLGDKMIIMLEPRRLAARNAAERIASLLDEQIGERVGYQIRMERRVSAKTKILVVTEGILTRMLQSDPALESVAMIIFDEFHERSLNADLSLALSLQSQEFVREDLKIMVMSATLNASAVKALLEDAPLVASSGKTYGVKRYYLDPGEPQPDRRSIVKKTCAAIEKSLNTDRGDILVFLPGAGEIKAAKRSVDELLGKMGIGDVLTIPLYGVLAKDDQQKAILPDRHGRRKVVLSTNIAETSLTIEGIKVVIDSGFQRVSLFHSGSGMNRLETIFISEDSAIQRSGRAGRLSEGICYRLWHKNKSLIKHQKPEILRSDLTQMMLELAQWGVKDVSELKWLDLPDPVAVRHAVELLKELMMLADDSTITKHGREALSLGVHPRLAHMILMAKRIDRVYEASLLSSFLVEKEIFKSSGAYRDADISLRLSILHEKRFGGGFVDRGRAVRILEQAALFYAKVNAGESGKMRKSSFDSDIIGVLLGYAYPDRIAKQRAPKDHRYLLSGGKGAFLDIEDTLMGEEFLAVADLNAQGRDAKIFLAASIRLDQIEMYFGTQIKEEAILSWNRDFFRVESRVVKSFLKLMLYEKQSGAVEQEAVSRMLIEGIRLEGLDKLPWKKESDNLRERVNFLNAMKKDKSLLLNEIDLPDFSDEGLLGSLDTWLLPYIVGMSDLKNVQKLDLKKILLGMIPWHQQQLLDKYAPRTVTVPSGSKIVIDYSDTETPVLAVRLQELFGLEDTPTVLKGEKKLLIHLLSPAYRPMQVTYDLKSFWQETYHEVKKELKGKYKKHFWPDDPLSAQAVRGVKRVRG